MIVKLGTSFSLIVDSRGKHQSEEEAGGVIMDETTQVCYFHSHFQLIIVVFVDQYVRTTVYGCKIGNFF